MTRWQLGLRAIRALALTPDFPPATGGIQVLVHRVVRHAARLQVRVVTRTSPGYREFDRTEPLDIRRAGRAGAGPASNLPLNARGVVEAWRFRPHVVLSGHIVTSPAAWAIHRVLGAPVVQYVYADELRTLPRLAAFAMRADAVVAISGHTQRLALEAGADPARVRRIPAGVDLPSEPLRKQAAGRPTLVTVARLEDRYKGHDTLVRALPIIRERVPEVEWLVVGEGSLRPALERLVAAEGVSDAVRFMGAVSDADRDAALGRAHVFAMPSRLPPGGGGEGFGIVYLEAAAHGLPAVAGDVGGARDAIVHGETGLLVDPLDPAALAQAISGLLLDPARARALGEAAARRAQGFAWPLIARQLEELIFAVSRWAPRER